VKFPVKSSGVKRRAESWWLLVLKSPSAVLGGMDFWLERRPAPGIWAGLFCPPVLGSEAELQQRVPAQAWQAAQHLPAMTHNLTHRELRLYPVVVGVDRAWVAERQSPGAWVTAAELVTLGLPTPVRSLYQQLAS
jgi:A/G-specific adenine glycosylase